MRLAYHQIGLQRNDTSSASKKSTAGQNQLFSNSSYPEEQPIDNPDTFIDIMVVIAL